MIELAPYLLASIASLGGMTVGMLAVVRVHGWRLNEQKELLLEHKELHKTHANRLNKLEIHLISK